MHGGLGAHSAVQSLHGLHALQGWRSLLGQQVCLCQEPQHLHMAIVHARVSGAGLLRENYGTSAQPVELRNARKRCF